MNYCVLDLEMNQPSGTIIEVGAVCYHSRSGKITSRFSQHVRLPEGELLNPDIAKLTGITEKDLAAARAIDLVQYNLAFWAGANGCSRNMATWGSDYWILKEAYRAVDTQFEFPWKNFLNVKEMATYLRAALPGKQRGGLKSAIEAFGLTFQGEPHRALIDAENTALLMDRMLAGTKLMGVAQSLVGTNPQSTQQGTI
jgi:inhibitor of KinA sporulation pathway (predicted exonuclease)